MPYMQKVKRELLAALNFAVPSALTTTQFGKRWVIPNVPRSMDRLMRGRRDLDIASFCRKHLPNVDQVVDIGANVGQSLILFRSLYPECTYIGFEPNPVCSAVVTRIIALNKLRDCTLITGGIAKSFGTLPLYVGTKHLDDPTATLVTTCHDQSVERSEITVIAGPLGAFVPGIQIDSRTLIKIDVEGFEADVIESLDEFGARRPTILFELLESWSDDGARREALARIESWKKKHHYRLFRTDTGESGEPTPECGVYALMH